MNNEQTKTKRNWKQELKDVWNEYKAPIKVGCWCLTVGAIIGFVKGLSTQSKFDSDTIMALIDKIPHKPDVDDIPLLEILEACDKEDLKETLTHLEIF